MDILESIKSQLRTLIRETDKVFLFGSRARGTAKEDSDWDILIILDKERIKSKDYDEISYPLVSMGWDFDQIISPILYTKNEWEKQSPTLFYKNINQEALRLL